MEKLRFWEGAELIESIASMDEIKGMMCPDDAYRVLLGVCVPAQAYSETSKIRSEIMDSGEHSILCTPLEAADRLIAADAHLPMQEDVFLFVEKAYLDGYANIDPRWCAFQLGRLYSEERYGHIDDSEAFLWFERSSKWNMGIADGMLGKCYLLGRGTPQNYEKAYKLLTKYALFDTEWAEPLLLLGHMYRDGLYVEKDEVQALDLYREIVRHREFQDQIAYPQALVGVADYQMDRIGDRESVHLALSYYQQAECEFYDYLLSHPTQAQSGIDYAKRRQNRCRQKLMNAIDKVQREIDIKA